MPSYFVNKVRLGTAEGLIPDMVTAINTVTVYTQRKGMYNDMQQRNSFPAAVPILHSFTAQGCRAASLLEGEAALQPCAAYERRSLAWG